VAVGLGSDSGGDKGGVGLVKRSERSKNANPIQTGWWWERGFAVATSKHGTTAVTRWANLSKLTPKKSYGARFRGEL
jgi:hypothetical protein